MRGLLADFGTACNVKSGERLRKAVGTRTFWSPEIFDNNYGVKVDVWAVGVIMYGLVMGRYPFRDEAEIRAKQVRIAKHVHPNCEELMRNMRGWVGGTEPPASADSPPAALASGAPRPM